MDELRNYCSGGSMRGIFQRVACYRKLPTDADAFARARAGLESFRKGLECFAEVSLPACAIALEKIRESMNELEIRVAEADLWESTVPGAGHLLQVQCCLHAGKEDPREWLPGKIYISKEALLFDSDEEDDKYCSGPLFWTDMSQALRVESNGETQIRLRMNDGMIHWLAEVDDPTYFQEFCGLTDVGSLHLGEELSVPCEYRPVPDRGAGASGEQWVTRTLTDAAGTAGRRPSFRRPSFANNPLEPEQCDKSAPRLTLRKQESRISTSYDHAGDEIVDAEAPDMEPIFAQRLARLTIEDIRAALHANDDWIFKRFLEEELEGRDFEVFPWAMSRRVPGTKTRRLKFRMKVPQEDVPSAMRQLVKLPATAMTNYLCRIGSSENVVVMVYETKTPEVPFGENFVVQDFFIFRCHPEGGVLVQKYVKVRWVQLLPWYARGPVTLGMESMSKSKSIETGVKFANYLDRKVRPDRPKAGVETESKLVGHTTNVDLVHGFQQDRGHEVAKSDVQSPVPLRHVPSEFYRPSSEV